MCVVRASTFFVGSRFCSFVALRDGRHDAHGWSMFCATQEFIATQQKMIDSKRQHSLAMTTLQLKQQEKRRLELTSKQLSELPESTVSYEAIGRMCAPRCHCHSHLSFVTDFFFSSSIVSCRKICLRSARASPSAWKRSMATRWRFKRTSSTWRRASRTARRRSANSCHAPPLPKRIHHACPSTSTHINDACHDFLRWHPHFYRHHFAHFS